MKRNTSTNTRNAWTPQQEKQLRTASRKRTPVSTVARTLRRTEGATRQKAHSMGLSLGARARG